MADTSSAGYHESSKEPDGTNVSVNNGDRSELTNRDDGRLSSNADGFQEDYAEDDRISNPLSGSIQESYQAPAVASGHGFSNIGNASDAENNGRIACEIVAREMNECIAQVEEEHDATPESSASGQAPVVPSLNKAASMQRSSPRISPSETKSTELTSSGDEHPVTNVCGQDCSPSCSPQAPSDSAAMSYPGRYFPNPFMSPFLPGLPNCGFVAPQTITSSCASDSPHSIPLQFLPNQPQADATVGNASDPPPIPVPYPVDQMPSSGAGLSGFPIPMGPQGAYGTNYLPYPPFMYQEMLRHYFQLMMANAGSLPPELTIPAQGISCASPVTFSPERRYDDTYHDVGSVNSETTSASVTKNQTVLSVPTNEGTRSTEESVSLLHRVSSAATQGFVAGNDQHPSPRIRSQYSGHHAASTVCASDSRVGPPRLLPMSRSDVSLTSLAHAYAPQFNNLSQAADTELFSSQSKLARNQPEDLQVQLGDDGTAPAFEDNEESSTMKLIKQQVSEIEKKLDQHMKKEAVRKIGGVYWDDKLQKQEQSPFKQPIVNDNRSLNELRLSNAFEASSGNANIRSNNLAHHNEVHTQRRIPAPVIYEHHAAGNDQSQSNWPDGASNIASDVTGSRSVKMDPQARYNPAMDHSFATGTSPMSSNHVTPATGCTGNGLPPSDRFTAAEPAAQSMSLVSSSHDSQSSGAGEIKTRQRSSSDGVNEPVWVLRNSYVKQQNKAEERSEPSKQGETSVDEPAASEVAGQVREKSSEPTHDSDTDNETDRLLGQQRSMQLSKDDDGLINVKHRKHKNRRKEVMIHEPAVLIEGVLFRANYLGSTQLVCEGRPTKATRMMQAHEAVSRIKSPDGEPQPSTEVDLFISTEKIMVLNTDLQDIMMDHPLRTISYIADIGDLVVLMARRVSQPSTVDGEEPVIRRTPKIICHVFDSDEAQFIAQSIGQAFQVAYIEFLRQNGIDDPSYLRELDYQEVLNSQEIFSDELEMFSRRELQKDVVVPKGKGEPLGLVIVESGWGSMLPTVVIANLAPGGAAARSNQLNIGDQVTTINGISLVGLPLATCQTHIKGVRHLTAVKLTVVHTPPVVEVRIKRPDTKYQLGFSVQNGVICSLLRGGIAERGGVRVGHRIIEINGLSVVAVAHEKIVTMLATSVGEIEMKTMPTSMFRLLTGQEIPTYI